MAQQTRVETSIFGTNNRVVHLERKRSELWKVTVYGRGTLKTGFSSFSRFGTGRRAFVEDLDGLRQRMLCKSERTLASAWRFRKHDYCILSAIRLDILTELSLTFSQGLTPNFYDLELLYRLP